MSKTITREMTIFDLPSEIEAVFREFRTCELSTLAKDGTPVTWPMGSFFQQETGRFFLITSIGLPQKAFNIRRNPRVSLFFSDPTGSGLTDPPYVLVQGNAEAPEEIITGSPIGIFIKIMLEGKAETPDEIAVSLSEHPQALDVLQRQPAGAMFSSNPLMRFMFDWYHMRLPIWITPRRILWWEHGDFTSEPHELVVSNVG